MKAWWLGPDTLPHGDGRRVCVGVTHKVEGEIKLCAKGLHASVSPLDALAYGTGLLYLVEMSGTIIEGDDKLVASERTYLGVVKNTDAVLRCFARLCALDVVHLWDAPDVVVRYLKTGDASLRDAADAASRAAARAARAADLAAAWAAAWAAHRAAADAASAAARAAALAVEWAAERDAAARDVARNRQSTRLYRMLMEEVKHETETPAQI